MDINLGRLVVNILVRREGIDKATAAFTDFAKTAEVKLNRVAQRVRTVGYLTTAVFTYPMVAGTRSIINVAKDFEYEMQKIVGLTGMEQEVVDDWRDSIHSLSKETGKGPVELAESLYFISSSGIRSAEALDVLRQSAMAAEAGLGDTQEVADLLTSVLNAYAGTGIHASEITDQLVAAVRVGKAEADQFASSIGQVIPIASQLGVSFAEIAGGMAAMTLQGASARTAGVYLKNVLNALLKEAGKSSPIFKDMGLSWADLRSILKEKGLITLMNKLREITNNYDESLVHDLFPDIRALTGELMLVGKNFKYNVDIIDEVIYSFGSLDSAVAAASNTMKVRLDKATASLQVSLVTLGKHIGEAVIPLIQKFSDWVDRLTEKFDSLTERQKENRLMWAGTLVVLGPISLVLSSILYMFSFFLTILSKLIAALKWFNTLSVATKLLYGEIAVALGAVVLVINGVIRGIIRQREEMGKQNKIYQQYLDKLKEEKELRNSTQSILDKASTINSMNLRQLQDYQTELAREIALWEDKVLVIRKENEAWKENNKEYATLSKRFEVAKENYEGWKEIMESKPKGFGGRKFAKEQVDIWEADYKTLEGRLKKMTAIQESRLPEATEMLQKLGEAYSLVSTRTERLNVAIQKSNQVLEDTIKLQEAYSDILEETAKNLGLINKMSMILPEYDKLKEQLSLYEGQIKRMLELGIELDDKQLQSYVNEYKRIDQLIRQREKLLDVMEQIQKMKEEFQKSTQNLVDMPNYERNKDGLRDLSQINNELERQLYFVGVLADTFTEFFEDLDQGWKKMLKSFVRELERYLAKIMAWLVVYSIVELITGGGTELGGRVLTQLKKTTGVFKGFAKGGVVPSGYPNDTYPAMLSSGEVVFTPSQLRALTGAMDWSGNVRFEIEDTKLVGLLQRRERINKSYL